MNYVIGTLQSKLPRTPYPLIRLCSGAIRFEARNDLDCENVAVQTIICSIGKTPLSAYEISLRPNATIPPETPELFQKDICAYSRLIQTAYES